MEKKYLEFGISMFYYINFNSNCYLKKKGAVEEMRLPWPLYKLHENTQYKLQHPQAWACIWLTLLVSLDTLRDAVFL